MHSKDAPEKPPSFSCSKPLRLALIKWATPPHIRARRKHTPRRKTASGDFLWSLTNRAQQTGYNPHNRAGKSILPLRNLRRVCSLAARNLLLEGGPWSSRGAGPEGGEMGVALVVDTLGFLRQGIAQEMKGGTDISFGFSFREWNDFAPFHDSDVPRPERNRCRRQVRAARCNCWSNGW